MNEREGWGGWEREQVRENLNAEIEREREKSLSVLLLVYIIFSLIFKSHQILKFKSYSNLYQSSQSELFEVFFCPMSSTLYGLSFSIQRYYIPYFIIALSTGRVLQLVVNKEQRKN